MKGKATLADLKKGEHATIDSFTDAIMSMKLMDMGCVPGEKVMLDVVAPLGDPIAIKVAGYILSLRKDEAATVVISKTN